MSDLPLFAAPASPPQEPSPKPKGPQPPVSAGKLFVPKPGELPKGAASAKVASAKAAPAAATLRAKSERFSWASPRTWLPVFALAMFVTGAVILLKIDFGEAMGRLLPDRSLPTVVIDPGHGGHDSGAINNGLREKDLTLDTALRLEKHLRSHGFPVVLTRRDDRFLELFERAHIANQIPRALFVSVHFNDNTTASGDGVETFYAAQKAAFSDDGWSFAGLFERRPDGPPADQGASFARAIQASMVFQLGVTDRGAKPRQLAVVRLTRCPAALVEGGFLNNPAEARNLARDEYREALAVAIADGINAYWRETLAPVSAQTLAQR